MSNKNMENRPKFLLCAKYDQKLVLKIRALNAFGISMAECSDCLTKVIVSDASRALLALDRDLKPLCSDCTAKFDLLRGDPQYAMTSGQLRESRAMTIKLKSQNN